VFPHEIDVQPSTYLEQLGTIFARFDSGTQDSGNISYGVRTADASYFVKTAGDPSDLTPYLDFDGRVGLLRNAADLAQSVAHATLPTLHAVIESPGGPLLVYEWRQANTSAPTATTRPAPTSASGHSRRPRSSPP